MDHVCNTMTVEQGYVGYFDYFQHAVYW